MDSVVHEIEDPRYLFQAIFEQAAIGLAYVALDGRPLRVNSRFSDITGYTPEELLQTTLFAITHPDDIEATHVFFQSLREGTGQERKLEKRYLRKDGSTVWINVTTSLMRNSAGAPTHFISIFEDITTRKRMEEERDILLKREQTVWAEDARKALQMEQHTQNVLQVLLAMAETLVVGHVDEKYAHEQKQSEGHTTMAVSEIGRRLMELADSVLETGRAALVAIDPETEIMHPVAIIGPYPAHQQQWMSALQQQSFREFYSPTQVARLMAGEMIFIDLTQEPVPGGESTPIYRLHKIVAVPMRINNTLVGVLGLEQKDPERDYSESDIAVIQAVAQLAAIALERDRLLRQHADAQATEIALREANRHMDEFLSIASHELKNPLAAIKGNLQLAERRLQAALQYGELSQASNEAEQRRQTQKFRGAGEALQIADRQLSRLNRLVEDLLDISRAQVGKMEMHLVPCDLVTVVRDVIANQRSATPQRIIHLREPLPESAPVMADPGRIEQVIGNYLSNAIKSAPKGSQIEVALIVDDEKAVVSVRDEGIGLPHDQHKLIWERFHQVHEARMRLGSADGLGLGLYISRMIIEQHAGTYGLNSAPGEGSTFWFSLPLKQEKE